jgi:hypothetical protein
MDLGLAHQVANGRRVSLILAHAFSYRYAPTAGMI